MLTEMSRLLSRLVEPLCESRGEEPGVPSRASLSSIFLVFYLVTHCIKAKLIEIPN